MESLADVPIAFMGQSSRTRYTFPARGTGIVQSGDVPQLVANGTVKVV